MSINSYPINTIVVNSTEQIIADAAAQVIISYEQTVSYVQNADAQTIISFEQNVYSSAAAQNIIEYEQIIQPTAEELFYTKNGFNVVITLGSLNIPRNQVHGDILVRKYEGDSDTATFTTMPFAGTYNLYEYQGKEVTISVKDSTGWYKIFTGKVDIPVVNLIEEKITLNCIADRDTLISGLANIKNTIGYFSNTVNGTNLNAIDEIYSRLDTIPYSLDFDGYGNYSLTSWTPKATADFTWGSNKVYYREPSVTIESSKRITNKINLTVNYLYQRLHQRQLTYTWQYSGPVKNGLPIRSENDIGRKLAYGTTVPRRDMIANAASATGWYVTNLQFTDVWPAGWYRYDGATLGWAPVATEGTLVNTGTVDQQGNAVYTPVITKYIDNGALLCRGATWRLKRRFAQNITETYNLTVQSTQSQALYGVIEENLTFQVSSDFDPQEWETNNLNRAPDAQYTKYESTPGSQTYYINRDDNRTDWNQAIVAAINKAKTQILRAHRDSRISFETFVSPRVELKHTISLTGKWVQGKGKVLMLEHRINPEGAASTSIDLALYRSVGSSSSSTFVAPTQPTDINPVAGGGASLSSRWGYDPTIDSLNAGYFGNGFVTTQIGAFGSDSSMSQYQEVFVVDAPAIPDTYRNNRTLTVNQSYNVSIPNDNLSVIFYWSP